MNVHKNARLTPQGRSLAVQRVRHGESATAVAREIQASLGLQPMDDPFIPEMSRLIAPEAAEAILRPLVSGPQPLEGGRLSRAQLLLAESALSQGPQRYPEVTELLATLDPRSPESERAELVAQVLAFFQAGDEEGGLEAAQARLRESEGDSAARYVVAAAQARSGQLAAALENLLTLIQRDRRYRDDGARRALLALFQLLGQASGPQQELIHECRRRLQLLL